MPSVRSTQHDGRYTILVSDDDPGVRRGLQLLLRSRGYAVWGYTTGHALLADPRAKEAQSARSCDFGQVEERTLNA